MFIILFVFKTTVTVLTTVLPTSYMTYALASCTPHVIGSVLVAWNLTFSPTFNPLMAIYFIRPYRRVFCRWFNCRVQIRVYAKDSVNSVSGRDVTSKNSITNTAGAQ